MLRRKETSTNSHNDRSLSEQCPIYRSTQLIAPRWRTHIIVALATRDMRFGELAAAIPLATERMIALRLHELEHDAMIAPVERDGFRYYALTDFGRKFLPILENLFDVASASAER